MTSGTGRGRAGLDKLDLDLIAALREHPRAGILELSRRLRVARGTVESRLRRLEETGVIAGYGPEIDVRAAGFTVQAYVSLEIAQGALDELAADLEPIPGVLEAHATTGQTDVICRVAARSHEDLQRTLLALDRSRYVVRSTSVIVLSTVVQHRALPLLRSQPGAGPARVPAYQRP